MKYLLAPLLAVVVLIGMYFYNELDNVVTDSCQAGVLTARQHLGYRGTIDPAFYKCASNTIDVKADIFTAESGCAYGIGVGLDYFDPRQEWNHYAQLMGNKQLTQELMSKCMSRYNSRHN